MELWKKLEEDYTYRGWRQMMRRRFLLPNGQSADFDILDAMDYVTVAALTEDDEFLLTRQYRPGPESFLLSFPEGGIEAGEAPAEAARRELLEETGYQAGEIHHLRIFQSSYTNQRQYCLLATGCRKTKDQRLDQHEFIEVFRMDPKRFRGLLRDPGDECFTNVGTAYLALDFLGRL